MFQDAHGIIECEHADEAILTVDNGQSEPRQLSTPPRHHLGILCDHAGLRRPHERRDHLIVIGPQQIAQADDAHDSALGIEHRDRVHGLCLVEPLPHSLHRGGGRGVLTHRHILRGHSTPNAAERVAQQGGGECPLVIGQPAQQAGRERGRCFLEQPRSVIGIKLGEQPGHLGVMHALEQLALQRRIECVKHLSRGLLGQQPECDGPLLQGETFEHRGELICGK